MHFHIRYFITAVLLLSSYFAHAATIKGQIKDAQTGDPLIEAVVGVKDSKSYGTTNFEGHFTIKDMPVGEYVIVVNYLGYIQQEQTVRITDADAVYTLNFKMVEESEIISVEVIGAANKESEKYALNQEKNADNITNVISAKTIQLLPDITVAGVLQRVSGVTLERTSTGDARYAIIRGMDQRYNYTLVNGIKIPSPDNKYRYVPMDMFPADIIERLEVVKSLTPNMEGDAIGGAINVVMKDAPEHFAATGNIGGGFSQLLSERGYTNFDKKVVNFQSPSDIHGSGYTATPNDFTYKNFDYTTRKLPVNSVLGFSIGGRFFKSKKLGAIVAASYQNLYRGSNSTWFKADNQPAKGNLAAFDDMFVRQYNTNQKRYGLHAKVDYKFNAKHKLSWYNMYMKLDEVQYRNSIDTSLTAGRKGLGTGNVYIDYRSRIQNQSIYNSTLQGEHHFFDHLKLTWSGVYSIAKSVTPDWTDLPTVHTVSRDTASSGGFTTTPTNIYTPLYKIWTRNTDRDWAEYINLSYHHKLWEQDFTWSIGQLYRDKLRDNLYNEWDLVPKTSSQGNPPVYNGVLTPDLFLFNGPSAAQGNIVNPLTYTATEKIQAYYAQVKMILQNRLEIIGGVRYEKTVQGWKTIQDPNVSYGAVGKVPYHDWLPSINLKYSLTEKQNLRLSYYAAINRPGFGDYVPFKINDDSYTLSGNPKLQHATANNYDIRYEYFPKGLDQLLVGAFYKTITNPIETAILFTGTSSASLQPNNFGTATNFGFELALTKYIGKFGLSGNYTYTHSAITTSKLFYNYNGSYSTVSQTRPLQGQSPHIANVSALYKNKKAGLDVQVALVYTGKKIVFVSPYQNLDYWQRGMAQLDFSIEKRLFQYFTLYCKINNVLNTPVVVDILQNNTFRSGPYVLTDQTSNNKITVQKDYYGQTYLVGIRFKI